MDQAHRFYEIGPSVTALGKRGLEWDLNNWRWDGDLFIASASGSVPSNFQGQQFIPVPVAGNSSNSSSSCSEDVHPGFENAKRELERKRRAILVDEDGSDGPGALALKLGANHYPVVDRGVGNWEGSSGKKTKLAGGSSSRAVCQVEDCGADLSKAKDYHRRHKVCEMHSKARKALVGNVMQRFCQQCSRFHVLQEFDEGKRSCRRRLAGHNKRRRKTQPDAPVTGNPMNDEQANSVLLMSVLKILSNMHANNRSDQAIDQALVAQLLSSLAQQSGLHADKCFSGLLHESQKLLNGGSPNRHSEGMSDILSNGRQNASSLDQHVSVPVSEIPTKGVHAVTTRDREVEMISSQKQGPIFPVKDSPPSYSDVRDSTVGRMKLNNFDLNDIYIDSDDGEDLEISPVNGNFGTVSNDSPSWLQQDSHQSSPPQISGNSDSASAQSPSSSSGEAQSRTDRIVFKLFGKEPSDFPLLLRGQILDWLAHSPTDIESYIRPGCVILTIYLRLAESMWEELSSDLSVSLTQLFDISDDALWRTGWVYVRAQHQIAFVYNGSLVMNTTIPLQTSNCSRILNVVPIAVSMSEQAQFRVRGSNLSRPTTRLLCALEGKYLVQRGFQEPTQDGDSLEEKDETECINLSCSIPAVIGRGFIEVEDLGLSSSFFPFIVAENDVCAEIRTLERLLELEETDEDAHKVTGRVEARCQAMDFLQEMGWLLHRTCVKLRLGSLDPNSEVFSFQRYKWLIEFSMDHDWCAVVKKLLDVFLAGNVGYGDHPSLETALSELGLLHRAVRRNCRSIVELLLRYVPGRLEGSVSGSEGEEVSFLFRPDAKGPAGLTPLHIAAARDGSEDLLDALTDDPGKVGLEAWKSAHDSTGSTPEDYARLRGHYSYIHLIQKKINRSSVTGSVVLDIPTDIQAPKPSTSTSFAIGRSCKACNQKRAYGIGATRRSLVYRPAMLSMVAIAAVCVCVALLFKSLPQVVYVFEPFRWEMLDYGTS